MSATNILDKFHPKTARTIEGQYVLTQCQFAQEFDIHIGKVQYRMKVPVDSDLVKRGNFSHNKKNSENSSSLSPSGNKAKFIEEPSLTDGLKKTNGTWLKQYGKNAASTRIAKIDAQYQTFAGLSNKKKFIY